MTFRVFLLTFAVLTCLEGFWITSAELIRPRIDARAASEAQKARAALSADLGLWRGDLWAEDALIQSGTRLEGSLPQVAILSSDQNAHSFPGDERAKAAAAKAISLSPLNSQMWLLLAALASAESDDLNSESALEMVYLTGESDIRTLPARLTVAGQSTALSDKTIQDFVRRDIGFILNEAPGLKPMLAQIYKNCRPENRAFFESAFKANNASF